MNDLEFITEEQDLGRRLDAVICQRASGVSRSRVQLLIRGKQVTVDGEPAKPSMLIRPEQTVLVKLSQLEAIRPQEPRSEKIDLDVLFEDDHLIVINKPPAMVVHPAKGHWSGTLTAGLMYRFKHLSEVGGKHRPGIVHRLDRDTSGVIVVAKTDQTHTALMKQFESRTVQKNYVAVVTPSPDRDRDRIEAAIGVHPYQREKMAIRNDHAASKSARTFYEVRERIGRFAIVDVQPKTGRTHQIRVHLAHIGCPVLADRQYSGRSTVSEGWLRGGVDEGRTIIDRQALHAESIEFQHPASGETVKFRAPLAADIEALIEFLRRECGS